MGKLRKFKNFGLIYARLAEILRFELRNSQKFANRQVTSFLINNQLCRSKSCVTSRWSFITGIENYGYMYGLYAYSSSDLIELLAKCF